jgi:hypothetical protein
MPTPASHRAAGRESGSAYLMALLVLVVLTILGLALVLVTQSEMSIGSNERTLQRVFYDSDSGIALAGVRMLVDHGHKPVTLTLPEPGAGPLGVSLLGFQSEVKIAPTVYLSDGPCNLCEINNAGTYSQHAYHDTTYVITVSATRRTATDPTPLAQSTKTISSMFELQPWSEPSGDANANYYDSTQLAQIKF